MGGVVILIISIMQDTTETFTSISACLKSLLVINAFTEGKSASRIDLEGSCSTYANKFSTLSRRVRRSSVDEGGLRSLFPDSLIRFSNSLSLSCFSSFLSKEVIFSYEAQNSETRRLKLNFLLKVEAHRLASGFDSFFFFLAIGLVKLGLSTFFAFKWQVGLVCLLWAETSVY